MKPALRKVFVIFFVILAYTHAFGAQQADQIKIDSTAKVASIFKINCAVSGCHSGKYPKKKLNLEEDKFLAAIVDVSSQQMDSLRLVDTDNPKKSYLLMKIKGEQGIVDARMPADAPPLKNEEIKIIEEWIFNLKKAEAKKQETAKPAANEKKAQKVKNNYFKRPAFWSTRFINLPTTKNIGKNNLLFRISHRFTPTVKSGYDSFFGLNGPASILFSLGYGIQENLSISLARANYYRAFELSMKWLAFEQGKLPLSVALISGGTLVTQPGTKFFESDNMKFNVQLCLSRQFSESLSLMILPAYSSNTNHWELSREGSLSLGIGGKFIVANNFAIIGEYIRILSGYYDYSDGWGLGIESKVGGHVFQIFLTNSKGMTSDQFITGGDLELKNNDYRLGFNIFRSFWF